MGPALFSGQFGFFDSDLNHFIDEQNGVKKTGSREKEKERERGTERVRGTGSQRGNQREEQRQ